MEDDSKTTTYEPAAYSTWDDETIEILVDDKIATGG